MKVSPEIVVKMPVTSKMAYAEVDAGSWPETSIPCHTDLSIWLPKYSHNIAASFPRTSHPRKTRWKPQCLLWPSLRSRSPSFLQYPTGDTGQIFHRGKGLQQGMDARKWDSLGPSWKWSLWFQLSFQKTATPDEIVTANSWDMGARITDLGCS